MNEPSIPFLITHDMRHDLNQLRFSDTDIKQMTPQQVWHVLREKSPKWAALFYASLGWRVIPVHTPKPGGCSCGNPNCSGIGKHPRLAQWQIKATTDVQTIKSWWAKWLDANIGIATGAETDLVVLDIDSGTGGEESLLALEAEHGKLPDTVESLTGGGGRHLLFAYPPGVSIRNDTGKKLGPGLDIRGSGGFIVAPPSLHQSGRRYEWEVSSDPSKVPVAKMPDWMVKELAEPEDTATPGGNGKPPTADVAPAPTAPQDRNNGHHSGDSGEFWLEHYLQQVTIGNRNDIGLKLAEQYRDMRLIKSEAKPFMLRYAAAVPQMPSAPYTDREALASLDQAYKRPPRAPARSKKVSIPTDDELADRWLKAHPLTAWGMGEFRRYEGGIWPVLPLDTVRCEIEQILRDAKPEGIRPSARLLNSVTELARVEIQVPSEKWDATTDFLVFKNGVLSIPTQTLLPHTELIYATSRLEFNYDPRARSDLWQYVLDTCLPDAQNFLQEFAGLSLTTDTKYELAIWFYGPPGSGKSTVLTGLQAMLGNRAGLLGLADIERSRFALTELPGKTLVVSAEQPAAYLAATHILNAIISGEPVTVDRKFREPVTIIPRVKLVWAMNDLPRVNSAGSGLFRRVKVIRFPQIPEAKRDPTIKEKIKLEGAAILNWALDGLERLRARDKFEIPSCVVDATKNFQEANDIPSLFVAEKGERGPLTNPYYRTQGSLLYAAYSTWCEANGHKPQSSTTVAEDWRRLGFEKHLVNGIAIWRGIHLK